MMGKNNRYQAIVSDLSAMAVNGLILKPWLTIAGQTATQQYTTAIVVTRQPRQDDTLVNGSDQGGVT